MSYNSDVRQNPATLEHGKFVEIVGDSRFPATSVVRVQYAEDASMPAVTSVEVYPKYAVTTFLANASDINIQLSASEVDIGNVGLVDNTSGSYVYGQIIETGTVSGLPVGAVSVRTQNYPQLDALTAVDYATNTTIRSLTAASYNTRVTNTIGVSTSQTLPVALKDITGNNVAVTPGTSALNVNVTNPIVATVDASSGFPVTFAHTPNFDAFGRLRTSTPLTLFDSSHRYRDNNLWSSLTAAGGSYVFNANQGLVDLTVTGLSGSSVVRETTKAFSYQPGKSLLVLNTFVLAPSANNLRQRVGYFGQDNGMYFQLSGGEVSFVERSLVNGSPATETIIPISAWNNDRLDGTGPSGFTLDVTKAQIQWMDIEWLGLGTVRMGFVIDGKFVLCHSLHHANKIASTYITTASLPLRYEITNTGATGASRTMKHICSSVISEGGYELRGLQQAVGTAIASPKALTLASTFYPVVTLRLKAAKLDAIVILTAISLLPVTNGAFYEWRVIASGTTAGGAGWVDAGTDSAVEYRLDATSVSGGRVLASGYMQGSNQGSPSVDILKEALFKFQLERNGLTSTPYELTLAVATGNAGSPVYGSMDWEEISR